ncbi:MAG: ribonuclease D [Xanthomonadales bacterium]|nr:ribonuclease D [Xanthomonadales bacterium]
MTETHAPVAEWIRDPAILSALRNEAGTRIGIDTEFIRERTYWPVLALVQIATPTRILLVDPRIHGIPEALREWLDDASILKVMHSAGEDLIALRQACGALPAPLFDTQTAAALAGMGAGLGYQALVREITGVELAKGETRTDWLQRPLTPAQREYAADDVRHLFALHDFLNTRLRELGRQEWLEQDCALAIDLARVHRADPWPHLGVRAAQVLDRPAQTRLLRLLRWRDRRAVERDLPRNWVIAPELAIELARIDPVDRETVSALLARTPKAPQSLVDAITQALSTAVADEVDMPLVIDDRNRDRKQLQTMQTAVAKRGSELGLPEGVLASRRILQAWQDNRAWPETVSAWRRHELDALIGLTTETADA